MIQPVNPHTACFWEAASPIAVPPSPGYRLGDHQSPNFLLFILTTENFAGGQRLCDDAEPGWGGAPSALNPRWAGKRIWPAWRENVTVQGGEGPGHTPFAHLQPEARVPILSLPRPSGLTLGK